MGDRTSWAKRECILACKHENPEFDFESNEFDYGCSCYKSALKAYESMLGDGHSGFSWNATTRILKRLLDNLPLTPITDEDFFSVEHGTEEFPAESPDYMKERGLKSNLQCPRMSSLFREETLDGKVSYRDVDRYYCVNIENPSDTYFTHVSFLDEQYPITMPYYPSKEKFEIYIQTFLTDRKHGDFDTEGIIYMITPEGKRVEINRFYTETDEGWKEITKQEYDELLKRRIDKLSSKAADSIMWTLISNSAYDREIERREAHWRGVPTSIKDNIYSELEKLCAIFDNPENYKYNTFHYHQVICRMSDWDELKDTPLLPIADFIKNVYESYLVDILENNK